MCFVRDEFASLPAMDDAPVGDGYAFKLFDLESERGAEAVCTDRIYAVLMDSLLVAEGPVSWELAVSTPDAALDVHCAADECKLHALAEGMDEDKDMPAPAKEICRAHPDWTKRACVGIAQRTVSEGMNREQVELAFGAADKVWSDGLGRENLQIGQRFFVFRDDRLLYGVGAGLTERAQPGRTGIAVTATR